MNTALDVPPVSEATERARAFVTTRLEAADALGAEVARQLDDAASATATLDAGLAALADPEYLEGQRRVAPGLGPVYGVRSPLLAAVGRAFRKETRRDPVTPLLLFADRLLGEQNRELRWFAFGLLERIIEREPERTWQLVRRAAREADDWITVDSLAHVAGRGILAEPYRWAELDQLVFSPSRWERRLVGSTVATIPFIDHRRGRTSDVVRHGLELVGQLIGDAEPDVQKALAWALRSLAMIDSSATAAFLSQQTGIAVEHGDGHRAWVVRDALPKLPADQGAELRQRLEGVRRRPGAPPTSRASEAARRFEAMGLGRPLPEPPLE
jgi:3-methyladenine DNA glycosylase AlkD